MAHFPNGVVVVTTVVDGSDHAMTANSFTSVSLDPALVLFCVQRDSRFHAAITQAQNWVVNLLAGDQADVARWFAERGRPLASQMTVVEHTRSPDGIACLDGAYAHMYCTTEAIHPGGDHSIVVGRVRDLRYGVLDQPPLLYLDHRLTPPSS